MNKDKTILIVDDEAELRQMVQGIFARAGYGQVLTAGTGAEALALCRQAMPDLVILDVMLPDIDGFAVLRALRQDSRVPVLTVERCVEAEDKFAGFEAGADDYLAKPFLPRELLFRAQAILRRTCPDTGGRVQLAAASVDLGTATAPPGPGQLSPHRQGTAAVPQAVRECRPHRHPPGPCAKPCAGRYGRAMRAPWPPISATCGKRSSRTPPDRCPL